MPGAGEAEDAGLGAEEAWDFGGAIGAQGEAGIVEGAEVEAAGGERGPAGEAGAELRADEEVVLEGEEGSGLDGEGGGEEGAVAALDGVLDGRAGERGAGIADEGGGGALIAPSELGEGDGEERFAAGAGEEVGVHGGAEEGAAAA